MGPFLLVACADTGFPPTPPAAEAALSYSISGSVGDTAYRPLVGARVEIVSGGSAGTFALAREDSHYSLPGTFTGTVVLVASQDGYVSQTKTVTPSSRPVSRPVESREYWVSFSLEKIGQSTLDIAGVYSMTLTAAGACDMLPEEARTRRYTATIVPSGPPTHFVATLSDARFFELPCFGPAETCRHNQFGIGLAGDDAGMYADFIEQIGESESLVVSAAAQGTFGPSGITATLAGDLYHCPSEPYLIDQGTWVCQPGTGTWCSAQNHQLTLIRR